LDNLTHTLTGVLLGRAGLKRLTGRATAALVIASNLPDIDSFIAPLWGEPPIEVHRGFTHGVGGTVILPFFTAAVVLLWEKLRPSNQLVSVRFWPLLLVASIGGLFHSLLDYLTSYGTRLLEPFSHQWFYGDAWFIVDPWVWLALIVGLELSWRAERLGRDWHKPALFALGWLCIYTAFNLGLTQRTEAAARYHLQAVNPTLVLANPEPLLFWRRQILWRNQEAHGWGSFDFIHGLRLQPGAQPNGLDNPRLAAARSTQRVAAFLFWSRMPVVIDQGDKRYLTDQRFAGRPGARSNGAFLIPLD
jgi:inner membrane protein